MFYIAIIVSIISGISNVISRIINSNLANKIGVLESTFFNYVVGLFFATIFLITSNESIFISMDSLQSISPIAYLGGLMGVVVVCLSSYLTPKISVFYLTIFLFVGQLFVGVFLDFLTLGELSVGKVIGGLLVVIGLTYNLILDKKATTLSK
ncbi:MAG: DMT family transporter [Clostridium sp.]|uniref:DMT family transporter n=1 Tax=Clostridium sp. TaxID=1506 RepID=UPI003051E051